MGGTAKAFDSWSLRAPFVAPDEGRKDPRLRAGLFVASYTLVLSLQSGRRCGRGAAHDQLRLLLQSFGTDSNVARTLPFGPTNEQPSDSSTRPCRARAISKGSYRSVRHLDRVLLCHLACNV